MKKFKTKFFNILASFLAMLFLSATLIPSLSSCVGFELNSNLVTTGQTKQVTFIYNNGRNEEQVLVEKGKTVTTPPDPIKTNCLFSGWYTEDEFIHKYDFSQAVKNDLTLYAKYQLDGKTLTNTISTNTIKGVVKIHNKNYTNVMFGGETYATSQGSGFCFEIQNGYYYVLTNCHVVAKDSTYHHQKLTIEDYQGKTYAGYLYQNPSTSIKAISADYDLACLYFTSSESNVTELPIVSDNPLLNEDVISLGAPKSQSNTITYGEIFGYQTITLTEIETSLSNVTFDVIAHNALINSGSSGGPLLNANLQVVGVNYAGGTETHNGFAIPAVKVHEFLNTYVYK